MNSKRKYQVVAFGFKQHIPIERLFEVRENDYEFIYALQEVLDEILDLKVDESLFVQLDRGNQNDKGVIIRTA
jgi:hypothetical protein